MADKKRVWVICGFFVFCLAMAAAIQWFSDHQEAGKKEQKKELVLIESDTGGVTFFCKDGIVAIINTNDFPIRIRLAQVTSVTGEVTQWVKKLDPGKELAYRSEYTPRNKAAGYMPEVAYVYDVNGVLIGFMPIK